MLGLKYGTLVWQSDCVAIFRVHSFQSAMALRGYENFLGVTQVYSAYPRALYGWTQKRFPKVGFQDTERSRGHGAMLLPNSNIS